MSSNLFFFWRAVVFTTAAAIDGHGETSFSSTSPLQRRERLVAHSAWWVTVEKLQLHRMNNVSWPWSWRIEDMDFSSKIFHHHHSWTIAPVISFVSWVELSHQVVLPAFSTEGRPFIFSGQCMAIRWVDVDLSTRFIVRTCDSFCCDCLFGGNECWLLVSFLVIDSTELCWWCCFWSWKSDLVFVIFQHLNYWIKSYRSLGEKFVASLVSPAS